MIFGGDEPTPVRISTDTVRVRALSPEEVGSLDSSQLVYVQSPDFRSRVLEPAHIQEKGRSDSGVYVLTIYGIQIHVGADKLFQADDLGEETNVLRTAGTRVSSTLFLRGIEGVGVIERIERALAKEFGPGIVEVWNMGSEPVRDLRYDVYETRTAWIPDEGSRKGKDQKGTYQVVEKRLLARGVVDGHQDHFMGTETPGWNLLVETHRPDPMAARVL